MKTILFVEDEPTLQKTVGQFLEKEGYQIKSALDGEIGLALAKEIKPDLILLDLILPKKDGFKVLEELKKDQTEKDDSEKSVDLDQLDSKLDEIMKDLE